MQRLRQFWASTWRLWPRYVYAGVPSRDATRDRTGLLFPSSVSNSLQSAGVLGTGKGLASAEFLDSTGAIDARIRASPAPCCAAHALRGAFVRVEQAPKESFFADAAAAFEHPRRNIQPAVWNPDAGLAGPRGWRCPDLCDALDGADITAAIVIMRGPGGNCCRYRAPLLRLESNQISLFSFLEAVAVRTVK